MKKISEKLNLMLKSRSMTKKELCRRVGVTETGFAKMLENSTLRIDVLEKIANELGCDITYFISDNSSKVEVQPDWQREKENLLKQIDYLTSALRVATLGKFDTVHLSLSELVSAVA